MRTAMYKSFIWLIDPNAGAEEDTYAGAAIGAIMSICGLILFAILLTLLQEAFSFYLDSLREGSSRVMESGHVVIIGLTEVTLGVVRELCMAHEEDGGTAI